MIVVKIRRTFDKEEIDVEISFPCFTRASFANFAVTNVHFDGFDSFPFSHS